jgi:monofunctional chorismate mutase
MKLEQWRTEIDEIDSEIVALLDRRAKVARKIGSLKANSGLPIVDNGREEKVLRRVAAKSDGTLPEDSLGRIYHRILQESRLLQVEAMAAAQDASVEVY